MDTKFKVIITTHSNNTQLSRSTSYLTRSQIEPLLAFHSFHTIEQKRIDLGERGEIIVFVKEKSPRTETILTILTMRN